MIATKEVGLEATNSEPWIAAVDASDILVVARVHSDGPIPGGHSVQWTIFGKFNVSLMVVGVCFFSAGVAIGAIFTVSMGVMMLSASSGAVPPSSGIGVVARASARPLLG